MNEITSAPICSKTSLNGETIYAGAQSVTTFCDRTWLLWSSGASFTFAKPVMLSSVENLQSLKSYESSLKLPVQTSAVRHAEEFEASPENRKPPFGGFSVFAFVYEQLHSRPAPGAIKEIKAVPNTTAAHVAMISGAKDCQMGKRESAESGYSALSLFCLQAKTRAR